MNNILQIGTILRERYKITDVLSSNTGFGIRRRVTRYNFNDTNLNDRFI
jgi:eukaryotic-like serine/threonine-protein kinase